MPAEPLQAIQANVGRTLASVVTDRLRQDIVACMFRPGERLRFEALRAAYGASYSTLREALTALVSDGLVVMEEQRGFRVAPVSRESLLDITSARVLIERETLRLSIERGGDDWEDSIVSTFHRLDRAARRGDEVATPDWDRLHREFHEALASACGSPVLLSIRANLYEQSQRYRRLAVVARAIAKVVRDNNTEHRDLMEATMARRADEACRLIETHIRATADNVLQGMRTEDWVEASEPDLRLRSA